MSRNTVRKYVEVSEPVFDRPAPQKAGEPRPAPGTETKPKEQVRQATWQTRQDAEPLKTTIRIDAEDYSETREAFLRIDYLQT